MSSNLTHAASILVAMRRVVLATLLLVLALLALAVARGLMRAAPAAVPAPAVVLPPLPTGDSLLASLAEAIRLRTVEPEPGDSAWRAFGGWLARSFPLLVSTGRLEEFAEGGRLITWPGRDTALAPVLLVAHLDVVPAEPAGWRRDPFGGAVVGDTGWGRGARDDKGPLVAMLAAVEAFVAAGRPRQRTIHLAIGHDEERGGEAGAAVMARALAARGVHPLLVLDEGLPLGDGLVPGVPGRVALIGTAEKGVAVLDLEARGEPGHSSVATALPAPARLARALEALRHHPLPARFQPSTERMLHALAPRMPWPQRVAVGNMDLLRPLLVRALAGSPAGNATVRTTLSVTRLEAGQADNAVPSVARATVHARLLPGTTPADLAVHVGRAIGDSLVRVRLRMGWESGPAAPDSGVAWHLVAGSVEATWPGTPVAPALVVGATDGRHYESLGAPVYRFTPLPLGPTELSQLHGPDERIAGSDLVAATRFYLTLLLASLGP